VPEKWRGCSISSGEPWQNCAKSESRPSSLIPTPVSTSSTTSICSATESHMTRLQQADWPRAGQEDMEVPTAAEVLARRDMRGAASVPAAAACWLVSEPPALDG
jgi:hypothetical protein